MAQKMSGMTLRQFHDLGHRVLRAAARRKRRGEGVHGLLEELGATTISEKNRLQEARNFARMYDREQLDRLCELGRDVGRPLTQWHVAVLIRVADRRQRDRLAKRSAQQKWSVRRLELELRRIRPHANTVARDLHLQRRSKKP